MCSQSNPLVDAIRMVGMAALSKELGVSHQAVRKWLAQGRMPRTEWTLETNYGQVIERLTEGAVTRERLLAKWEGQQPEKAAA